MSIKADIRIYYEIEYSRRGMPPFCVTSTGVIQCRDFTVTFFQFLKKATASLYTFAVIFLQPQRQWTVISPVQCVFVNNLRLCSL